MSFFWSEQDLLFPPTELAARAETLAPIFRQLLVDQALPSELCHELPRVARRSLDLIRQATIGHLSSYGMNSLVVLT